MKNQKNERGITLVALVVTIVVLLILAGITIMYVMSDNGIFGQATTAQQKSDEAAVQEAVSTALVSLYTEVYSPSDKVTNTNGSLELTTLFNDNLSPAMKATGTVTATEGTISSLTLSADFTVTYKGKSYTVSYGTTEEHLKNGTGGVLAKLATATK